MDDDSGLLVKNGLEMERWMAKQCRDGQLTMDSSAKWTAWQWTARD